MKTEKGKTMTKCRNCGGENLVDVSKCEWCGSLIIIDATNFRDAIYTNVDETATKDPLFEKAKQLVKIKHVIRTSTLQKEFKLGYPHAVKLIEQLVQEKIIKPEGDGYIEVGYM